VRVDPALRARRLALVAAGASAVLMPAVSVARIQPIDQVRPAGGNTPIASGDLVSAGRGLLAANDVAGALAAFRQAAVAEPNSVTILNGIAACYDRFGRHDVARRYYDEALSIDPQSLLVQGNLGWSLYRQGRDAEAIPWLQHAAAGNDTEISAVSRRLLALIAVRLRESAIATDRRAVIAAIMAPAARIETAANGESLLVAVAEAAGPVPAAAAAAIETAVAEQIAPPVVPELPARPETPAGVAIARPTRLAAATASAAVTLVEPAATAMRIETAANGEARLIVDAPALPTELIARLGEDAALTEAPRPWTPEAAASTAPNSRTAVVARQVAELAIGSDANWHRVSGGSALTPAAVQSPRSTAILAHPQPTRPAPRLQAVARELATSMAREVAMTQINHAPALHSYAAARTSAIFGNSGTRPAPRLLWHRSPLLTQPAPIRRASQSPPASSAPARAPFSALRLAWSVIGATQSAVAAGTSAFDRLAEAWTSFRTSGTGQS
jgi:hypothetical protein